MILESELPKELMLKRQHDSQCVCGGSLSMAWGGYYGHNCFVLRCNHDPQHTEIKPRRIPKEKLVKLY